MIGGASFGGGVVASKMRRFDGFGGDFGGNLRGTRN